MITINTPNTTNTFFVKADGADYIQCPVAEAEGIAVLRYIPVGADSVEGEVYAIGSVASGESTENLFVTCLTANPQNHLLLKRLKSDLSHVSKLSALDSGDNQFAEPRGIAVDDTYIYIADTDNDRIQKRLKSDLSYVSKIGNVGSGNDQFNYPEGIAVDDTYIYIADSVNHRIQKRLKSDLSYVSKIGNVGSGDDQFSYPLGIAVDDTYIYITDRNNNRIQKRLKSDLSYVSKIGSEGSGDDQFSYLQGIAVDDTYIYIVERGNHRIQKRLKSDLSYVSKIGSEGSGDDQFDSPQGIAVDDTYIYITDRNNNRIQKRLKSDLSYVSVAGDDDITQAWAIAVEPNDWDYIQGGKIRRFLPTTVTFTAIGITAIDIFAKKHSSETWLQVGKSLDASGGSAQFRLLPSDFVVGDVIDLKLKDVDTDISAIAESLEILPSFTLDVYPTGAKALESPQTFSGTGLSGKELTITLTSGTGSKVVTTTPVSGVWSEDIALTTGDGFDSGDNVNVEIARTSYDRKDYGELYSVTGSIEIDDSVEPFVIGNIELDSAFDVTVDSNLEGKTVIVEASNGGSWVEIGTGVVASGTVTVSCIVPSSDFDANDSITVRARYGTVESSGVGLSVIATITITGTPTTAGAEENLTGASNGVEVEGFYKLASDEDWTSAGTVSVVKGAYTIPITIADAGTYDFKVEDTTDRDGFAQLDDVIVASGIILTALQITNAADAATKGDTYIGKILLDGDNIILAGATNSSKIVINGTAYLTGYSSYQRSFVISITKSHVVNWVNFYNWGIGVAYPPKDIVCKNGDYYSVIERNSRSDSKVYNISKIDGSTQNSITLQTIDGENQVLGIGLYDSKLYVAGYYTDTNYNNFQACWEVAADLSVQSHFTFGGSIYNPIVGAQLAENGQYIYRCAISTTQCTKLNVISKTSGSVNFGTMCNKHSSDPAYSATRFLSILTTTTNEISIKMFNTDLSTTLFSEKILSSGTEGSVLFVDSNFKILYNDTIKFFVDSYADSDTAIKNGNVVELTPYSASSLNSRVSALAEDASYYYICASIKGSMESGFVPGDATKYDGFIMLIEK